MAIGMPYLDPDTTTKPTLRKPLNPCGHCLAGNHDLCWIVYCWGCSADHRQFGVGSPMAGATHGLTS